MTGRWVARALINAAMWTALLTILLAASHGRLS